MATPAMTAPARLRSVSMPANVTPGVLPFHPKPVGSRRLRVAHDLGISVAVADKILYGQHALNLRYAEVIESDIRAGDYDAVALWIAPAVAAEMGEDVPHLTDAWREYDDADCAEDTAESTLNHRDPETLTDEELEQYAKAVARELYRGSRYLASLRRAQQERKATR